MTATTLPAEIVEFAAAVRGALADLPADEVEELTDGLEADLAEAYAEDLARELPDPRAYAAELRGAAGLPLVQAARSSRMRDIADSFTSIGTDLNRSLRRSPAMVSVLDFGVSLRPAWWVLRGWVAYQTVDIVFFGAWKVDVLPPHPMAWLGLMVMVVGSVLLGLRSWPGWLRALIVLGNVFAVFMTAVALGHITTKEQLNLAYERDSGYYYDDGTYASERGGVWMNGEEVTNLFAYDANGTLLAGVQLFDQEGRPLTTSLPGGNGCLTPVDEWGDCETPGAWAPVQLETGATAWNVYPMAMVESSHDDPTAPLPGARPQDRPAPFLKVPALMSAVAVDPVADESTDEKAGRRTDEKSDAKAENPTR